MNYQIIAVDFDGTLCFSKWPELGEPNKPLIEYLKSWRNQGNKLILWTCRAGEALDKAVSVNVNEKVYHPLTKKFTTPLAKKFTSCY